MSEEHVKVCRTQHTQPLVCKSSIGTQMDLPLSLHIGLKCVLLDGSKCYSMGPRKGMALATSKILARFWPFSSWIFVVFTPIFAVFWIFDPDWPARRLLMVWSARSDYFGGRRQVHFFATRFQLVGSRLGTNLTRTDLWTALPRGIIWDSRLDRSSSFIEIRWAILPTNLNRSVLSQRAKEPKEFS